MSSSRFSISAWDLMTFEQRSEWNRIDKLYSVETRTQTLQARREFERQLQAPTRREERASPGALRQLTKKIQEAHRWKTAFLRKIEIAVADDNMSKVKGLVGIYLRSYNAKLSAYYDAHMSMKTEHRPLYASLERFAEELDPFTRSIEPAKVQVKSKIFVLNKNDPTSRAVLCFGIHNRARQYLLLGLIKACFDVSPWENQYGLKSEPRQSRDRQAAVSKLVEEFKRSEIEFVAEVDIKKFVPNVGFLCFMSTISQCWGVIETMLMVRSSLWSQPHAAVGSGNSD